MILVFSKLQNNRITFTLLNKPLLDVVSAVIVVEALVVNVVIVIIDSTFLFERKLSGCYNTPLFKGSILVQVLLLHFQ